jgi:hypothetical protein
MFLAPDDSSFEGARKSSSTARRASEFPLISSPAATRGARQRHALSHFSRKRKTESLQALRYPTPLTQTGPQAEGSTRSGVKKRSQATVDKN